MHWNKHGSKMLIALLVIITLVSSFGGGIRYRENFLDEVFGNDSGIQITNPFEPNIQKPPSHAVKPLFNNEVKPLYNNNQVKPKPPSVMKVVEEESSEQIKIIPNIKNIKNPTTIQNNLFSQISGFDGDLYASV
jgi:hypothetical protein